MTLREHVSPIELRWIKLVQVEGLQARKARYLAKKEQTRPLQALQLRNLKLPLRHYKT